MSWISRAEIWIEMVITTILIFLATYISIKTFLTLSRPYPRIIKDLIFAIIIPVLTVSNSAWFIWRHVDTESQKKLWWAYAISANIFIGTGIYIWMVGLPHPTPSYYEQILIYSFLGALSFRSIILETSIRKGKLSQVKVNEDTTIKDLIKARDEAVNEDLINSRDINWAIRYGIMTAISFALILLIAIVKISDHIIAYIISFLILCGIIIGILAQFKLSTEYWLSIFSEEYEGIKKMKEEAKNKEHEK